MNILRIKMKYVWHLFWMHYHARRSKNYAQAGNYWQEIDENTKENRHFRRINNLISSLEFY